MKIANLYLLSTDFINLIIEAIICTYSLILHYINTYRFFAQNIKISSSFIYSRFNLDSSQIYIFSIDPIFL